ncbi:MAG: T9SS type A sorting domain-containing protein [candidate division KSB1 bacterium]|nr:T9SS type A sorting domain-containing protein [candidate division KSB1 bacterium]
MRKQVLLFTVLIALLSVGIGVADYISNIQMPPSPVTLQLGEQLHVTFDYFTTNAAGVRIFVRPITNGAPSPGYGAHGSPVYPSGNGNGSGWFTINAGFVTVDHVRIQMYNADQSQLILECFVPVEYTFSTHSIYNIHISPVAPTSIPLGQNVNVTFDYKTDQPGGVRIFVRPFTGGATTPGYGAHGSPLYPTGSGSGSGFFTINTGDFIVDHIRFQMLNSDQSQQLLEFFVPVYFHFAANSVSNYKFNPIEPAALLFSQDVNLTFDYVTDQPGGARIFARPISSGNVTPNYAAHGSPVYPLGFGNGAGSFNITSGDAVVDHVRIRMTTADQSQLLYEEFIPVHYQYSNHVIKDIVFSPGPHPSAGPFAFLTFNQDVNLTFNYVTNEPTGVRIFARPFSAGSLAPHYAAHGSPAYPTGTGSGSGHFTIQSGDILVDQVRFQMYNNNQSQLLLELFVPVSYVFGHFGPSKVTEPIDSRPENYVLEQNYPNPFNANTVINYQLPVDCYVDLSIYNLLGQKIVTLVSEQQSAGSHQFNWDVKGLASGVYLYRLEAGSFKQSKKLILMQ